MERGEKIYLDETKTAESAVNPYLSCRDGVVEVYEYRDCSGYGVKTRLFLCRNTKHESVAVVRQIYSKESNSWLEESMHFDSDSFTMLGDLLAGDISNMHGEYSEVRNYNNLS